MSRADIDVPIQKWSDSSQCKLRDEALQWTGFEVYEIEGISLKSGQLSM